MKRNKLAMGLFLTLLVALCAGGQAYAKNGNGKTHTKMEDGEPVQTLNARQKTQHSKKKEAARRLKQQYQATSGARIVKPADEQRGSSRGMR